MSTNLQDAEIGDTVAVYTRYGFHGTSIAKTIIARTTKTLIETANGSKFRRANGYEQGCSRWSRIERWTPEHDVELATQRAERKLASDVRKLQDFDWQKLDQDQASAILATMAANGFFH